MKISTAIPLILFLQLPCTNHLQRTFPEQRRPAVPGQSAHSWVLDGRGEGRHGGRGMAGGPRGVTGPPRGAPLTLDLRREVHVFYRRQAVVVVREPGVDTRPEGTGGPPDSALDDGLLYLG